MAKKDDTPDFIEEFEGAADRMAGWIGEHLAQVVGLLVVVLGAALGWGLYGNYAEGREQEASDALEKARSAYFQALGASPGAIEEPQLANPKAAEAIRSEYLEEFRKVADEHDGTVAGALALFEVAQLNEKLGKGGDNAEVWEQALASTAGNEALAGLLHQRRAVALEREEAWSEAADAHEAAGQLAGYALRYWALADAARCAATAGDPARALTLYERVDREAPHLNLPAHLRAQFRELQATQAETSAG